MLPKQAGLIRGGSSRKPATIDNTIVNSSGCRSIRPGNMGGRSSIIPRKRPEFFLIAVDEHRNVFEIGSEVLDLGAVDQLLPLQHAAEQQADDHQHDGDFDQGKAGLIAFHYDNLLICILCNSELSQLSSQIYGGC